MEMALVKVTNYLTASSKCPIFKFTFPGILMTAQSVFTLQVLHSPIHTHIHTLEADTHTVGVNEESFVVQCLANCRVH